MYFRIDRTDDPGNPGSCARVLIITSQTTNSTTATIANETRGRVIFCLFFQLLFLKPIIFFSFFLGETASIKKRKKQKKMRVIIAAVVLVIVAVLLLAGASTHRTQSDTLTIVCTTPHTPARIGHMRRLCAEEGLVPFGLTTELGLFVDKNSDYSKRLGAEFPSGTRPEFPAHYATYLLALRLFLQTDFRFLLLLEDDIVRTDDCAVSVHSAIANAPPFMLLFLEYCYADCSKPSTGGYAYGYKALCTGACVFTHEGARDFLAFAETQPRMIIDILTLEYSKHRESSVVYATPPLFRQDRVLFPDGVSSYQGPVLPRCA